MLLDPGTTQALLWVALTGAVAGLLAGVLASARNLVGTMLMGVIGAIAFSAVTRLGGAPPIYSVGDSFSIVWGAVGGLVLGYVVGRTNH